MKEDGDVVEQERDILSHVSNYHSNLFTASAGHRTDELLQNIHAKVSYDDMNRILLKPFTEEEIKMGLSAIGDLKAPGADGMSSLFYKKHWDIVGADIVREVLQFLNGGEMPDSWNDTVVVLIPKVQKPERLKDLRPISLCNVIYKIASKVLSNRLKIILPEIIPRTKVLLSRVDLLRIIY